MGCRFSGTQGVKGKGVHRRDVWHSHNDTLHVLYEQPITCQVGRVWERWEPQTLDCSTQTERPWDTFSCLTVPEGSTMRLGRSRDRQFCHAELPTAHQYLPSVPVDVTSLEYDEPELHRQRCFVGCCNTYLEEQRSFLSQTDDDELAVEKPVHCLPLMHELDSGLGCTDGSFHQGELSSADTEEGMDEPVSSPPGCSSHGMSLSSESLVSSEVSDSGFHSIGAGEFHRFQRLLERKMRLYKTGAVPGDSRPYWDLESIPEALGCQSQASCWDREDIVEGRHGSHTPHHPAPRSRWDRRRASHPASPCSRDGTARTPDWQSQSCGDPRKACGIPERHLQHYHTVGHPQASCEAGSPRQDLSSRPPRLVRNRLLRARAWQLAHERSEVTTDDEVRGEARSGRYCSRTERRRHLLLAREQRQHRRHGTVLGAGAERASSVLLELSHRKLSRLRNRKLLDDWTTLEELLSHGSRLDSSQELLCPSPLLSVTTV